MNNKTLLRISLIISLLGTLSLILLSNLQTFQQISIKDINNDFLDKKIQIKGQIKTIKSYDTLKIINLQDKTGSINIIVYTNKELKIVKNQTIKVIGKVMNYKQDFEIQADKIVLDN